MVAVAEDGAMSSIYWRGRVLCNADRREMERYHPSIGEGGCYVMQIGERWNDVVHLSESRGIYVMQVGERWNNVIHLLDKRGGYLII